MNYSFEDRKKYIKKQIIFEHKICDCCGNPLNMVHVWKVNRFNKTGTFDTWYYCLECFDSKEEVLLEIDSDSYPFGIHPIDYNKKTKEESWAKSLSDIYRNPEMPLRNRNLPKKKVKKLKK